MQAAIPRHSGLRVRRPSAPIVFTTLGIVLVATFFAGAGIGAAALSPGVILSIIAQAAGMPVGEAVTPLQETVFLIVRLPRVCLAALAGAGFATAGALLQGVFRNPLADPGLVGVSSGAALAAVLVILAGVAPAGSLTLPIAAFLGALLTTFAVAKLSQRDGRTDVTSMVLVGVAVTALLGAAIGVCTFRATDPQLRSIVFWTLGGLNNSLWSTVASAAPFIIIALLVAPRFARSLNLFTLGETEARHGGVETETVKKGAIALASLCAGASVAVTGPIGFIGLVVPHLVRLAVGPDHRVVLPASALAGAALLMLADLVARTVAMPAEVPVGIITAFVGAPFFLYLLSRRSGVTR